MQVTADELRGAIAGQWVVAPPVAAARPGFAPAPFLMHGVGTDTREDLAGRLFVALRGERFDGNDLIAETYRVNADRILLLQLTNRIDAVRLLSAIDEHREVIAALRRRDGDAAVAALAAHLKAAQRKMMGVS